MHTFETALKTMIQPHQLAMTITFILAAQHLFPLVSLTLVRGFMLKAVSVSSCDSPHSPDVYLDAGPHPHQSRLSAGRSRSVIIGFDNSGVR